MKKYSREKISQFSWIVLNRACFTTENFLTSSLKIILVLFKPEKYGL